MATIPCRMESAPRDGPTVRSSMMVTGAGNAPAGFHTLDAEFLYLRLRRHDYTPAELGTWADRLVPFLAAGDDAFVFFRHDEVGRGPELALELSAAVADRGATVAG